MASVVVLLTSYNHGKFIEASIQSVLDQTFTDWEMIIVDDCSEDDSWEKICRFQDKRIRAVRNPVRMGPERAFRVMDELATAEFAAIFHSDDLWRPEKLAVQVEYLRSHPETGAVFTAVDVIDETGESRPADVQDTYSNCFTTENRTRYEWLNTFFYHGNALCHPSVLIRRRLYRECGLFLDGIAQGPDLCKWIRLCRTQEIHILPEKLTRYRVLSCEANTSAGTPENQNRSYLELMFIYRPYFSLGMDDLVRVFPQTEKYVTQQGAEPRFAAARVFLEEGSTDSLRLLALEVLFDLLNDPETAARLQTLYGYGFPQYVEETKRANIFHLFDHLADASLMRNQAVLYWRGNTFVPERSVTLPYCLSADGRFTLDARIDAEQVDALRLDLCQWHSAAAKIISFQCDGQEYRDRLENNAQWSGGVDVFTCLRPQYGLFFDEPRRVDVVHLEAYLTQNLQLALEQWNAFAPDGDVDAIHWQREERDRPQENERPRPEAAPEKKRKWPWQKN